MEVFLFLLKMKREILLKNPLNQRGSLKNLLVRLNLLEGLTGGVFG